MSHLQSLSRYLFQFLKNSKEPPALLTNERCDTEALIPARYFCFSGGQGDMLNKESNDHSLTLKSQQIREDSCLFVLTEHLESRALYNDHKNLSIGTSALFKAFISLLFLLSSILFYYTFLTNPDPSAILNWWTTMKIRFFMPVIVLSQPFSISTFYSSCFSYSYHC